ncbi:hypothetical protein QZH41_018888 [Actinostola sp. cb2023]|nr:hypothetical protein QZH41_018888 [Actinostola sp. cb2023]
MIKDNNKEIPDLVIGSDTIVFHENKILEKPKSKDDAYHMLKRLSGSQHKVYSGVALIQPHGITIYHPRGYTESLIISKSIITQFYEETSVMFGELTDDVIQGYIDTGEPMDKAGSYPLNKMILIF